MGGGQNQAWFAGERKVCFGTANALCTACCPHLCKCSVNGVKPHSPVVMGKRAALPCARHSFEKPMEFRCISVHVGAVQDEVVLVHN